MFFLILTYILLIFILLFFFAKISYKLDLVDLPNKRKIHNKATAFTGGIAISIAFILSIILFEMSDNKLNLIIIMALFIAVIGFIDDKVELTVIYKLILQIIPTLYLIIWQNLTLYNLGDYGSFKLDLGIFAIPFTIICVLFLTNAFNYFDGLDGTLSFASVSVFAILYFLVPDKNFQLFLILIFIPVSIFLLFNFSLYNLPKMFLGDSGSLVLGFTISFLLIYLAYKNLLHPILLAWSIVIFVYEFLSINLIRLKSEQNPFKAGRDHLHHLLFKKTDSVFFTNFLITFINIILFLIGYASFKLTSPFTSFILFITLFVIFFIFRSKHSTKT